LKPLLAQLKAELILASRRGENLLVTVIVPVALLLFVGSLRPFRTPGSDEIDFLVPGLLALAVMSASMVSLGIATGFERYYGVLKRLIGSPLPRISLLLAKTLAVLAVEVVQTILLLGVAIVVFGWRPGGSLVLAVPVLLLGSVAFAGIGLLMAGTLRAEATLALANGLYLVFLLLGGFVVPLDQLPGPVATISRLLPAAALADATRAALGAGGSATFSLLVLLVWAVVAPLAAAATFRAE
jgi:ABC-2 type transport system permease protein